MTKIENTLRYLGAPYSIINMDGEDVIYRAFGNFDFEVSGINDHSNSFTLYVWDTTSTPSIIGIYSGIKGKEHLKDILGYYAAKYQNLISGIRVERE